MSLSFFVMQDPNYDCHIHRQPYGLPNHWTTCECCDKLAYGLSGQEDSGHSNLRPPRGVSVPLIDGHGFAFHCDDGCLPYVKGAN